MYFWLCDFSFFVIFVARLFRSRKCPGLIYIYIYCVLLNQKITRFQRKTYTKSEDEAADLSYSFFLRFFYLFLSFFAYIPFVVYISKIICSCHTNFDLDFKHYAKYTRQAIASSSRNSRVCAVGR